MAQQPVYSMAHADIIVTHKCNMKGNCLPTCADKFVNTSDKEIETSVVEKFLGLFSAHIAKRETENVIFYEQPQILVLGGEPALVGSEKLIAIAKAAEKYNFKKIISSNGLNLEVLKEIAPYYDSLQITLQGYGHPKELDRLRQIGADKVNVKLRCDAKLTYEMLIRFIENTKDFSRRSVVRYWDYAKACFTNKDPEILAFMDSLEWKRFSDSISSSMYAMYENVRFKKETDEILTAEMPDIPKLYPSGVYNCTWKDETSNPYFGEL